MEIDTKDTTVISDRGSAVLTALNTNFKESFLRPCPKHIEDNLISDLHISKSDVLITYYWEAAKAKTLGDYHTIVEKIVSKHRGIKLLYY